MRRNTSRIAGHLVLVDRSIPVTKTYIVTSQGAGGTTYTVLHRSGFVVLTDSKGRQRTVLHDQLARRWYGLVEAEDGLAYWTNIEV